MTKASKRILLHLSFYIPRLHQGIVDYAKGCGWNIELPYSGYLRETVRSWNGEAVITDDPYYAVQLKARGVRIASLIPQLAETADCTVCADDRRIGELAADYFRYKGFRNFASASNTLRGRAFGECLKGYGHNVIRVPLRFPCSTASSRRQTVKILKTLPHPCALFCENDWEANAMLNHLEELGCRVPEDASVLGVGNCNLICNAKQVTLSSIETSVYERGWRIAEALDNVLEGRSSAGTFIRIPPSPNIMECMSTGFCTVDNPVLGDMIRYLGEHAAAPVLIADMARTFHLSVSAVCRLFMSHLGVSPKKVLLEARMNIARRLLLDTNDKISVIAEESGFLNSSVFFEAFHRSHFCTPEVWRRRNR